MVPPLFFGQPAVWAMSAGFMLSMTSSLPSTVLEYRTPFWMSCRMLSALLGINPNTVQKAFHLLEEEQLIESRTGAKSCMTLPEKTLAALRQELLSEELRNAARTLRQMGITKEDALRLLAQAWEEEET